MVWVSFLDIEELTLVIFYVLSYLKVKMILKLILCILQLSNQLYRLITDYIKMYGERVFGVLARDHREDIINDYEVAIKEEDRYEFLKEKTR